MRHDKNVWTTPPWPKWHAIVIHPMLKLHQIFKIQSNVIKNVWIESSDTTADSSEKSINTVQNEIIDIGQNNIETFVGKLLKDILFCSILSI